MDKLLKLALAGGLLYYLFVYRKKPVQKPQQKLAPTALKEEQDRARQIESDYKSLEMAPDASDYKTFESGGTEPVSALSKYMSGTNYDTAVMIDMEGWD